MNSLQFNAGTSAYMNKQYDDALEAFNKTLTSPDPALQAKANYNFANTLFRRGEGQEDRDKKIKDWRNAVEHYKSTLDTLKRTGAVPADPRSQAFATDTAYNCDLVQKRLDDLLKEPPKPPSGSPQDKQDKSEGKPSGDPSDQNQPPDPNQSPSPDQKQPGQGSPRRGPRRRRINLASRRGPVRRRHRRKINPGLPRRKTIRPRGINLPGRRPLPTPSPIRTSPGSTATFNRIPALHPYPRPAAATRPRVTNGDSLPARNRRPRSPPTKPGK